MKVKINSDVIINEKGITKDLEKFAEVCATTIIEEGINIIVKFATKQMAGYYNEYDPYEYDRTYQMYRESFMPFRSFNGNIYEGGINIDSFFTNHPKGTRRNGGEYTEEEIYDNVWIKGSHGFEVVGNKPTAENGRNDTRRWREIQGEPDRINKLKRAAYSKELKEKLLSIGIRKAKAQSYSILNFS